MLRAHARRKGAEDLVGPVLKAFGLGIGSGLSFPIGAMIGFYCAPISNRVNSMILAFGAGSLLFAVTVQMYAQTIQNFEMERDRPSATEVWATMLAGLAGAVLFLCVDRWLDTQGVSKEEPHETRSRAVAGWTGRETEALLPRPPARALGERTPRARMAVVTAVTSPQPAKRPEPKADAEEERIAQHSKKVAYALFAGLLIDGVPEGVFLGFQSARGELTLPLVLSLFIANFPEACSSASLLARARVGPAAIVGMWLALCTATGCLCGVVCWMVLALNPEYAHGRQMSDFGVAAVASVEGFTGGAMMACICKVMIPEAAERARGKDEDAPPPLWASTGLWCTAGFLVSTAMEVLMPQARCRAHVSQEGLLHFLDPLGFRASAFYRKLMKAVAAAADAIR